MNREDNASQSNGRRNMPYVQLYHKYYTYENKIFPNSYKENMEYSITRCDTCIVGYEKAIIILLMGTQITIENILLYPDSTRTLLSYRDICKNELIKNISSLLRLTDIAMIF
jgi:hypothetical protein